MSDIHHIQVHTRAPSTFGRTTQARVRLLSLIAMLTVALSLIGCAGQQSGADDDATAAATTEAASVHVSHVYQATPEAVWAIVGDPAAIADWHPAIAQSPVHDDKRTCTLGDGATVVEQITKHSDSKMSYTYRITESPLPFRNYESTISVEPEGDGARLTWIGDFEPVGAPADEVKGKIEGLYQAGVQGITAKLEGV